MEFDLFRKVVDEAAALGVTHVRVHNYGEPFLDKQLVEKVRYAKSKGIAEVGMISNGSLITEDVARGMIDAGLDAINISVDAAGKEVFESTRVVPGLRHRRRQHPHARAPAQGIRSHAPQADSLVRAPRQFRRRAGVHRRVEPGRGQDPRHRPAQLGRHAERPHRRPSSRATACGSRSPSSGTAACPCAAPTSTAATSSATCGPRRSPRCGIRRSTEPRDGSTWSPAAPPSADPAICRRRTHPSGLRNFCDRRAS